MIENQQKAQHRWSRLSPWLVIVIIVISTSLVYQTGCNESGMLAPSPTVPPGTLQLTDMQKHTFEDRGISISYPSGWEELPRNSSDPIYINCQSHVCMDFPLAMGVFGPVDMGNDDLQSASDFIISGFIERTGNTLISNDLITVNGMSMIKVVLSDTSSFDFEIWKAFMFVSDDGMLVTIAADSLPDCWEYYEPAVCTIASTYQFLD